MVPGEQYTVPFTLTDTTANPLPAAEFDLSYHWTLPDGTDRTDLTNRVNTPLPGEVAVGGSVSFDAHVKAPSLGLLGNDRQAFVLKWDLRDRRTGAFLSKTAGVPTLDQNVSVENPTSDELGLESFYQYSGVATGAGSSVAVNAASGNLVLGYAPLTNPGRGLSSFIRLTYNSQDTSNSYVGPDWSLSASLLPRLGTPLQFDPLSGLLDYPGTVALVVGDGTSHNSLDPKKFDYDEPADVQLYLQHTGSNDSSRAWVMTQSDRTQVFFDSDGFQAATVDRNGNTMTFRYTKTLLGNATPVCSPRSPTRQAGRSCRPTTSSRTSPPSSYAARATWRGPEGYRRVRAGPTHRGYRRRMAGEGVPGRRTGFRGPGVRRDHRAPGGVLPRPSAGQGRAVCAGVQPWTAAHRVMGRRGRPVALCWPDRQPCPLCAVELTPPM
jgi:hypothetical protein